MGPGTPGDSSTIHGRARWLNENVFQGNPITDETIEAMYDLGVKKSMELFKNIEDKVETISNPNGYLLKATSDHIARERQRHTETSKMGPRSRGSRVSRPPDPSPPPPAPPRPAAKDKMELEEDRHKRRRKEDDDYVEDPWAILEGPPSSSAPPASRAASHANIAAPEDGKQSSRIDFRVADADADSGAAPVGKLERPSWAQVVASSSAPQASRAACSSSAAKIVAPEDGEKGSRMDSNVADADSDAEVKVFKSKTGSTRVVHTNLAKLVGINKALDEEIIRYQKAACESQQASDKAEVIHTRISDRKRSAQDHDREKRAERFPNKQVHVNHSSGTKGRYAELSPAMRSRLQSKDDTEALARDVLAHLRRGPQHLVTLASGLGFAKRYNAIFHEGKRVNNGSWTSWLKSLPGVHVQAQANGSFKPTSLVTFLDTDNKSTPAPRRTPAKREPAHGRKVWIKRSDGWK